MSLGKSELKKAGAPVWVKVTKDYTDFAIAGTSNTILLYSLASDEIISGMAYEVPTVFSGGLIASYAILADCGGNPITLNLNVLGATIGKTYQAPVLRNVAGVDISATATSTIGNLDAANQGSITFWLQISTLP